MFSLFTRLCLANVAKCIQLFTVSSVSTVPSLHPSFSSQSQSCTAVWLLMSNECMSTGCWWERLASCWSHRFVCSDWIPGNSWSCSRRWMNECKSSKKAWRNFHVSGALHLIYTWTIPKNVIHESILPPGWSSFYSFVNQASKVNILFLTLAAVGHVPMSCRGRVWAAACSRTSFCAVERDISVQFLRCL